MKRKSLVCLMGTALLLGTVLSNQVNATSSGFAKLKSPQAAATATALPKLTGNSELLSRLYKDEKGRVIGGTVFPLLNYSPTMITGKPCPRVTKWGFEVVKMQPPMQDFGYVKDPCVVQNAVDDMVRTLYFLPAFQTPDSMSSVEKIFDTDPMNVNGLTDLFRKSMIRQYREGEGIYHQCNKPLYQLLNVDAKTLLPANPAGRVTGTMMQVSLLRVSSPVEPFKCDFVSYKNGSVVRTSEITSNNTSFATFQYDLRWNPKTKTWMVESFDGYRTDNYYKIAKDLLAASPVKP